MILNVFGYSTLLMCSKVLTLKKPNLTQQQITNWSTSNSINVTLSEVPSSTKLINRHRNRWRDWDSWDMSISREWISTDIKSREWGGTESIACEFNANSHVVRKNKHAMRHILSCSTRYCDSMSISGKLCVHQINRSCRTLILACMKNWLCDKKSLLCAVSPFFPCFSLTFHELQSYSIPQTSLNYRSRSRSKNMAKDISRNLILLFYCHANATDMKKKIYFSQNFQNCYKVFSKK